MRYHLHRHGCPRKFSCDEIRAALFNLVEGIAMLIRFLTLVLLLISSTVFAAEPIALRAGRLTMIFEPDQAMLRYVRLGNHLVLQGISAPVRNQFWGTVPPAVDNVRLKQDNNGFTLDFDVTCRQREIDFSWHGKITGSAEEQIIFTFDGVARSEFLRNRIGFCVLHAAESAGARCTVETVSGGTVRGNFPKWIAPHQPFQNIRTVSHEVAPGVRAKVRMEGDTFEMEDQRNWTDASFKTYCTPLAIPYPVKVEEGTKISQRIELSLEGAEKLADPPNTSPGEVLLEVTTAVHRMPGIGLRVSSQVETLTESELARLRELRLDHLRIDVWPAERSVGPKLRHAAEQAAQLDVKLVVGLHLSQSESPGQELQNLSAVLKEIRQPATWLLISANESQVRAARSFLTQTGQKGRIGRGEDTNFTELNRNRPDPSTTDLVSYGLNPQIHAFDNTSMVETLAIQGETVRSAHQFLGERPLLISPITLRPQAVNQAPKDGELPPQVDPRQTSLFAAGWTIGSVKYLAEAGANNLTYYETVGWLGIMEAASGTPLPEKFPSQPGQVFPVYHVLKELGPLAGGKVYETISTNPLSVIGLFISKDKSDCMLVANLTSDHQNVKVSAVDREFEIQRLDAQHPVFKASADVFPKRDSQQRRVLSLPPYGIVLLKAR